MAERLKGTLLGTSFGKAVAAAARDNPRTGRARSSIAAAEADILETEGAFRPSFDAGVDVRKSAGTADDRQNGITPFLSVRKLLFDGGAAKARRSAAVSNSVKVQNEALAVTSDALLEAVTVWADVYAARQVKQLSDQNLATHREFLKQIEERQRMGAGAQGDVLKLRARTADAQTQALLAEADLDEAEARFQEVFGYPPKEIIPVPLAPSLKPETLDELAIVEFSPRVRLAEAELETAQARLAEARAGRLPRVEVSARGQPDGNSSADVVVGISVGYSFDTQRAGAAAIAKAEAAVMSAEAELLQAKRDIRRAVAFLQSERTTGEYRQKAAIEAREANLRTVLAARDEFSIGRRQLPEVLDAQRDFVLAERALVETEKDRALVGYKALALTGDISATFGIVDPFN